MCVKRTNYSSAAIISDAFKYVYECFYSFHNMYIKSKIYLQANYTFVKQTAALHRNFMRKPHRNCFAVLLLFIYCFCIAEKSAAPTAIIWYLWFHLNKYIVICRRVIPSPLIVGVCLIIAFNIMELSHSALASGRICKIIYSTPYTTLILIYNNKNRTIC